MLETLIGNVPGFVYRCANDATRTASFVSEGARELTGYPAEAFTRPDRHYGDLIHPDDRTRVSEDIQAALTALRRFSLTYRIITANGAVRRVKDQGCGVFGADGTLEAIEGVVIDVTDHLPAESAIRESGLGFQDLFTASPQAMWVYDVETLRFLEVNDAAVRRYGFSRDEFLAMKISDIRPPEDVPRLLENLAAATTGTDHTGVWRHRCKDGTVIDVEITAHILEHAGRRAGLVLATDITGRRRAESVMRLQSSALNAAANAIMITDRAGHIEWVNPAWTALTGYTLDEARGQTPRILKSGAQDDKFYQRFWGSVLRGDCVQGELVNRRKDGTLYHEYETITPVAEADGTITHFIAVKQDITERRKADEKLSRLNRTYALLSNINQLIARAASRDELVANACTTAVEKGGFLLAWIALQDRPSGSLALSSIAGADAATEQVVRQFLHQPGIGCAVTLRALSSGRPALCNDIENDPIALPWRDVALERGYKSMASLPIGIAGRTSGTLNLYAAQPEFFDAEEINLLGGLAGDIGFGLEIQERELQRARAEASLRDSELRFRTVLETLALIGLMLDRRGRVLLCSDHLLALTGWSREEVVGRDWFSRFVPPEDREDARLEAFLKAIEDGSIPGHFEDVIVTRTGEHRLVAWKNSVLRSADGTIAAVMSLGEDITERRRAEQQVRELAAFPRLNPNPVLAFSAEGALTYANPAAQELAKRIGVSDIAMLLPTGVGDMVRDCLATGQARLRVLTRPGPNTISWSFHPIVAANVVHCYAGDITDRLALEEQLRQSQKMDAVGQLAGGVAHDFNNLLTVIQGNVSVSRLPGATAADQADALNEIAGAAQRAASLTRQLLTFSRRQVMRQRPVDVNEAVASLAKMLQRVIGEQIQLQLHLHPGQLTTQADPGMLDQVLINLALNARDAMPDGGRLTLATCAMTLGSSERECIPEPRPGPHVCIRVSDTGCGIPAEHRPHIFEPFFTTKEPGRGTGLGLATVFGIVKQHGGTLRLHSETGRGTTFEVFLPAQAGQAAPPAGHGQADMTRGRGETLLVVEDEAAVRRLTVRLLSSHGYSVLEAQDGNDALRQFSIANPRPHLVLTDLIMPGGLTGRDLAEQLRAVEPEVRTVFMSGYAGDHVRRDLHLIEGTNFLGKPFAADALLRCIRARLDAPDRHHA